MATALVYRDTVTPGLSGYAPSEALHKAVADGQVARGWRLGNRISSIQLHKRLGNNIWKNADRFTMEPHQWEDVLTNLENAGVKHPSSWSDCYHQLAPSLRRLPYTYNAMLSWWPGGPWAQARKTGTFTGHWRRYDLQGAYRWAATWGLPDPATYSAVTKRVGDMPGVFVVRLREQRDDLPPVFQDAGTLAVASHEELERYNLSADVVRGITWSNMLPPDYVERTLQRLPYQKDIARAYWGRWIARDPLTCWTPNAEWSLYNTHANFVFGWLIVGRVRLRVWEVASEAAHVYVDEVLIPHELPTGGEGEWKLKEEYPEGVTVHRTGWYGDARDARAPTMQTGVKQS